MNLAANGGDPSGNLLFVNFNQDVTSLAIGSRLGYKLFSLNSVEKLEEIQDYDKDDVCIVERLFSSSLVAIVSLSAPRKLKVCHFKKGTEICNYSYPNTILAVKLNRVRLLVTLEESLYIHNIRDMKVLHTIRDTPHNPNGLCVLSSHSDNCYLAYPGSNQIGEIQIFDAVNLRAVTMIPAHDSPVASLTFNSSATLLASASEKGTVIRVFSIPSGQKLFEFRRGVKRCAHIYSLSFSLDSVFLAASSNTETVHVFKLEAPKQKPTEEPQTWASYFGKALMTPTNFLPSQVTEVLAQERAFATIKLPHGGNRNICGLAIINKLPRVLVANEDGYLYVYNLDPEEGGECSLLRQHRLLPDGRERPSSADSGRASTGLAISSPKSSQRPSTGSQSSPRSADIAGQSPVSARGASFNENNLKLHDETEYPPLTVHNE